MSVYETVADEGELSPIRNIEIYEALDEINASQEALKFYALTGIERTILEQRIANAKTNARIVEVGHQATTPTIKVDKAVELRSQQFPLKVGDKIV